MIARIYTIPGQWHWEDVPATPPQHVFIFTADPYRETIKLRAFHKRRRVWSKCDVWGIKPICGKRRTCQVERWCQLSGFKREIK